MHSWVVSFVLHLSLSPMLFSNVIIPIWSALHLFSSSLIRQIISACNELPVIHLFTFCSSLISESKVKYMDKRFSHSRVQFCMPLSFMSNAYSQLLTVYLYLDENLLFFYHWLGRCDRLNELYTNSRKRSNLQFCFVLCAKLMWWLFKVPFQIATIRCGLLEERFVVISVTTVEV